MKPTKAPQYLLSATLFARPCSSRQAADVLFLDGGYAELCSAVAKQVDRPEPVNLTGSRLDYSPLQICSFAIAEDATARHVAAGNYNNRGVIYFAQGAYDEAIRDFQEAIRIQPTLGVAHSDLA